MKLNYLSPREYNSMYYNMESFHAIFSFILDKKLWVKEYLENLNIFIKRNFLIWEFLSGRKYFPFLADYFY